MTTGVDYNKTLNLPKTSFPMRADLSKREPDFYKNFVKNKTYYKLLERNANKPLYVLHDGPPYANGKIHLGTALNKILKDFIIKYKNMSGFKAPFVPGWDTHGLPIELKVLKSANVDKKKLTAIFCGYNCQSLLILWLTKNHLNKKEKIIFLLLRFYGFRLPVCRRCPSYLYQPRRW